jgi:fructan beta-fructosidase
LQRETESRPLHAVDTSVRLVVDGNVVRSATGSESESLDWVSWNVADLDIDLLVGGGNHPSASSNPTAVNLVVGGKVVQSASGQNAEFLNWVSWDVSAYQLPHSR